MGAEYGVKLGLKIILMRNVKKYGSRTESDSDSNVKETPKRPTPKQSCQYGALQVLGLEFYFDLWILDLE